jgi:predicted kinase
VWYTGQMSILYIPVGIPGCGKSHLAEALAAEIVVSTDAIREALTGDANNQDANGKVFEHFHEMINIALRSGLPTVADATNLTVSSRADLRQIVNKINQDVSELRVHDHAIALGVKTHLILFRNIEQAIRRNRDRDRVVPDDVMYKMIEKYERAVADIYSEPYDYVTEIKSVR